MFEERVKVIGKNFLLIALIVLISTQFLSVFHVGAAPIRKIGATNQSEPFESSPTVGTSSGITVSLPIGNAFDGDWDTQCNFKYGSGDGYLELSSFNITGAQFATIGWVDFKISYKATGSSSSDERYRIVYQVGASSWQVLQDWVSGAQAKFDHRGLQAQRTWSNQLEPNGGGWDWTDIGNVKVRIETDKVTTNHFETFTLFEVWLSVYPSTAPLPPAGISIQPSIVNVTVGGVFFIEVYIADIVELWGYQIKLTYNTTVLTALQYYTYFPFNDASPSQINDTAGYVAVSYSVYIDIGNVNFSGNTTLTRIYFQVDAQGESDLHFDLVLLSKWGGAFITAEATDGSFDNRVGFPNAAFSWTPTEPSEGELVSFNASSSFPNGGIITNYSWDFGDGQTDTGVTTSHSYAVAKNYPGKYKVTLTVTNSAGKSDSGIKYIKVTKHDVAVVSFTVGSATVSVPENVTVGSIVSLKPVVVNLGFFREALNVTFYANNTAIDPSRLTLLAQTNLTLIVPLGGQNQTSFEWNTRGMSPGLYEINATAGPLPSETHTADNSKIGDGKSSTVLLRGSHNMAVTEVTVSSTEVNQGELLYINATVQNIGNFDETFNLNVYYENLQLARTFIANKTDTLSAGANVTLTFSWNTTTVAPSSYRIYVSVPPVQGEVDETQNDRRSGIVKVVGHNILISGVTFVPVLPPFRIGETVIINVVVKNTGSANETNIIVTVKANETEIDSSTVTSLEAGAQKTVAFNWNTAGLSPGRYNISAVASPVVGETSTKDNSFVRGFVTLGYHDIAITNVTVSPAAVELGQQITIHVTVENIGVFLEQNFNVTAYRNDVKIGTIVVGSLDSGFSNNTLIFVLDTTGVARGIYNIKVVAGPITNEISVNDNTLVIHSVGIGYHDVAITDVTVSPTEVVAGASVSINVTLVNHGNFTETFDVTVKYGDTQIATQTVSSLAVGTSTTVTFEWDTRGVNPGDYVINAEATVDKEAHIADNTMSGDTLSIQGESSMLLYAVAGVAIAIGVAVFLLYFFKLRKPKH